MKWKTIPDETPKNGDKKWVTRFAILPMKMDDGYTVWLEKYDAIKKYHSGYYGSDWLTIRRESRK